MNHAKPTSTATSSAALEMISAEKGKMKPTRKLKGKSNPTDVKRMGSMDTYSPMPIPKKPRAQRYFEWKRFL